MPAGAVLFTTFTITIQIRGHSNSRGSRFNHGNATQCIAMETISIKRMQRQLGGSISPDSSVAPSIKGSPFEKGAEMCIYLMGLQLKTKLRHTSPCTVHIFIKMKSLMKTGRLLCHLLKLEVCICQTSAILQNTFIFDTFFLFTTHCIT